MTQSVRNLSRMTTGKSLTSAALAIGFGWMALGLASVPAWAGVGWQEPAAQPQTTASPAATAPATTAPAADATADTDKGKRKKLDKPEEVDPLKRPRSDKQRFESQKRLHEELSDTYKTWLNQDVVYIISDEEKKAFRNLSNDEERDAFIEQFWLRRNPDPDSSDNEFREEHYRRIAYANEHFAAGKPGWKTDRGHIYISFGKPDSIESHPSGGTYERPIDEGGGETSTFPFETWHYRYLEGIGDNIDLEFVDTCQCGDYHFTIDRSEKDALLHVPGAGQTMSEQMGQSKKADRFKGGLESLGAGPNGASNQSKQFDRIELAAKIFAPPPIKYKDLESFISDHKLITGPIFPIRRADGFCPSDGRYGAGADYFADQEPGCHVQYQGWRF